MKFMTARTRNFYIRMLGTAALAAVIMTAGGRPAEPQAWEKKSFGPLTFEVPPDWKDMSVDVETQKIWYKGDRDDPEAIFSVIQTTDIKEILNGLAVETQRTTTVGGKSAVFYSGTPREEKDKGILIILDEKDAGGKTIALIGSFNSETAWTQHKSVFDRIVASVHFKGTPTAPACVWDSYTMDPRQFAAQPGGVFPMRRNYKTGKYLVHVGPAGKNGLDIPPAAWRTFGPFDIAAGNKYAAIIKKGQGALCDLDWEQNSARLLMYSKPPTDGPGLEGYAVVYVRNDSAEQWYAICLEPIGSPGKKTPTPPSCVWDSYTMDPRQFAAQPGGVFPMRRNYKTGKYLVHVGPAGKNGLDIPPAVWRTFGPFDIAAGNKYAAIIKKGQGTLCDLDWEQNSARLQMYSKPPAGGGGLEGYAVVYVRNDSAEQWYAICLEAVGAPGGKPELHFDASPLQTIKAGGTVILKAKVSHIPPEVKRLKFSWYIDINECSSSNPPGNKVNFWYSQVVEVKNGEAECSIVMKAASQKKESGFSLIVQDEPYTQRVFLSTKTISYKIQ